MANSQPRCCASCKYWVPTEMFVHRPDMQPHEAREVAMETEMLRATHALCSWSNLSANGPHMIKWSPPWLKKRVGGGDLTKEDEGTDCLVWCEREAIEIARS